jgi:hypothetical protein
VLKAFHRDRGKHGGLIEHIRFIENRHMGDGAAAFQTDHAGPHTADGECDTAQVLACVRVVESSLACLISRGSTPGRQSLWVLAVSGLLSVPGKRCPKTSRHQESSTDTAYRFVSHFGVSVNSCPAH